MSPVRHWWSSVCIWYPVRASSHWWNWLWGWRISASQRSWSCQRRKQTRDQQRALTAVWRQCYWSSTSLPHCPLIHHLAAPTLRYTHKSKQHQKPLQYQVDAHQRFMEMSHSELWVPVTSVCGGEWVLDKLKKAPSLRCLQWEKRDTQQWLHLKKIHLSTFHVK